MKGRKVIRTDTSFVREIQYAHVEGPYINISDISGILSHCVVMTVLTSYFAVDILFL